MSYLPVTVPGPRIDEVNVDFWEHCNNRTLCFQQCLDCTRLIHPPLSVCPSCQSVNRGWKRSPERAKVFSFVWAHTAAHPSVADALPYNVVLVEFPELPGVRLISNVVNASEQSLAIGDELELIWETGENDQLLPRFRKK